MKIEHKIARLVCIVDNKILLTFSKENGYYFLPGGHIEDGENAEDALIRGIKEEIGIDMDKSNIEKIGEFENSWINKKGDNHEVNYLFKYLPNISFEARSQEDHIDIEWKSLDTIKELDIRPKAIIEFIK